MNAGREEALLRRALYGGILASLCASMGWLTWLFGQALFKDWTAIFGPLVGAALGVVIHGIEHYHKVAEYELEGGDEEAGEAEEESPPRRFGTGLLRSLVPLVVLFVFLTCEHVLGELLHEYLGPFAASIATLFPVGVIFSLVFGEKMEEQSFGSVFFRGVLAGGGAALAAAVIQWSMLGDIVWGGLFGWWIVVGIGLSFASADGPLEVQGATAGVSLALSLVVFFSIPGPVKLLEAIPFTPLRMGVQLTGMAVGETLGSPDVPGQSWFQAEDREEKREASMREDEQRLEASHANVLFADWKLLHPNPTSLEEPAKEWAPGRWLANLLGYKPQPEPKLEASPSALPTPGEALKVWDERREKASTEVFGTVEERRDNLARQLILGWRSTLVRSWLVMLLFCFGLGFAPAVEEAMRPSDYPNSRTARNDRILTMTVLAFLVLVCMAFRLFPEPKLGQETPKAVSQNGE